MIECRGRNKWFNLHKAVGYLHGNHTYAAVSISSKKPYMDMPPIYFAGPVKEVLALLDDLKRQIKSEVALAKRLKAYSP